MKPVTLPGPKSRYDISFESGKVVYRLPYGMQYVVPVGVAVKFEKEKK